MEGLEDLPFVPSLYLTLDIAIAEPVLDIHIHKSTQIWLNVSLFWVRPIMFGSRGAPSLLSQLVLIRNHRRFASVEFIVHTIEHLQCLFAARHGDSLRDVES